MARKRGEGGGSKGRDGGSCHVGRRKEREAAAKGGDRWPRLLEGSRNKEKSEIEKKREKSGGFFDFVLRRNQKPRGKIWRGFTPAVEFHEEAMAAYGGGGDCYCLRRLERELRLFVRETRGKEDRGCYLQRGKLARKICSCRCKRKFCCRRFKDSLLFLSIGFYH
ncbi:hypothetical protein NE237_006665 [Protea cynaroides]|uniref:Uncharacterized protein n=1 Tax=Protea cynaroides TaxID=273540 RepID=A0A9Q0KNN3_9MAGN|nr:hypothetical protein NE237_006665 [Protea cynaroides]